MNRIKWLSSDDDLSEALKIRNEVFVKEQGIDPELEFDGSDSYAISVLIYEDNTPVATGRIILADDNYTLGRICVLKEYRKKDYGSLIVNELTQKAKELGAAVVHIHSQIVVVPFYERLGFERYANEYKEAGILHVSMVKKIY